MKSATWWWDDTYRLDGVSIHALNEECDLELGLAAADKIVSIHALNEECDVSLT